MSSVLSTGATVSGKWKVSHLAIWPLCSAKERNGWHAHWFPKLPNRPCSDPTGAYRSSSFWTGLCIWFLFPLRQLPLSLRGKKQIIKWALRIWMVYRFNKSAHWVPQRLTQLWTAVPARPSPATRGTPPPGGEQRNMPNIAVYTQPPSSLPSPV